MDIIIFLCKDCRGMFFAAVNEPMTIKDSAKDIAKYLVEGHTMKQLTLEEVNKIGFGCDRGKKKRKSK